jgi:ATP-dependent DNA helicase RecQ
MAINLDSIREKAREAGAESLRPPQVKALTHLLEGQDMLVVWPTGSGKSLVYQAPSQVFEGMTVVISPLIALMDDQVLKARKWGWSVARIHSGLSREEREKRLLQIRAGEIKLLYVTPERFRQAEFVSAIQTQKIQLMAVDEAHCISQWGHDFRPDYSRLREVRRLLGDPQVVALTATATLEVQADIRTQLGMKPDAVTVWEGLERENLFLAAEEYEGEEEKLAALIEELQKPVVGSRIVYFTLISTLERISESLQVKKIAHEVYHGDRDDRDRKRALKAFLHGESSLILATPAFGLGVDKPDVRAVLHFETPGSLEAYFQEVGRAGRDGKPSHCKWFYSQNDLAVQMGFIDSLTPDPDFVRATYELLKRWQDRLLTLRLDDLREQLSFKNKRDFRLETALSFLDRWEVISWPGRRLDRLQILRGLESEEMGKEAWQKRRMSLQKKLHALVLWFRSEECRKVGIYKYFGWPNEKPCGFCDRCEAGLRGENR